MRKVFFLEMLNVTWFSVSIRFKIGWNAEQQKGHIVGCVCFVSDWCVTLDGKFNGFTSFTFKKYHFTFSTMAVNGKLILAFRLIVFSHFKKKVKFFSFFFPSWFYVVECIMPSRFPTSTNVAIKSLFSVLEYSHWWFVPCHSALWIYKFDQKRACPCEHYVCARLWQLLNWVNV